MRIAALTIPLVLFAGCASRQPQLPPEQVASNVEVCEAVFYFPPGVAQRAQTEATKRGIDCKEYMQAAGELNARRSAEAGARRQAALQILLSHPTVNCTTTGSYGVSNTTCR